MRCTKTGGMKKLALLLVLVSGSTFAAEIPLNRLMIELCPQNLPYSHNQFYVRYNNDAMNAYIPMNRLVVTAGPNGDVLISDPATRQTVDLGQPKGSWDVGGCRETELSLQAAPFAAHFNIAASLPYPCIDHGGVFPYPAQCQNAAVQLVLTGGGAAVGAKCTDKIQITDGSGGHKGARVGGDCLFN